MRSIFIQLFLCSTSPTVRENAKNPHACLVAVETVRCEEGTGFNSYGIGKKLVCFVSLLDKVKRCATLWSWPRSTPCSLTEKGPGGRRRDVSGPGGVHLCGRRRRRPGLRVRRAFPSCAQTPALAPGLLRGGGSREQWATDVCVSEERGACPGSRVHVTSWWPAGQARQCFFGLAWLAQTVFFFHIVGPNRVLKLGWIPTFKKS